MKENRPAAVVCALLIACLTFTMGYLLGSGSAETQVQVTVSEPVQIQQTVVAETPEAELTALDLNTASQLELETLPGIGPELAKRIIQYRQTVGGFISVEQLVDVEGIGEKRFSQLKLLVKVGEVP